MSLLKMCFPPTKQKKKAYKESCIVQSVLQKHPGKYISTSIFDSHTAAHIEPIQTDSLSSIQLAISKMDEWFYQRITRSWDLGDPSTLSADELTLLMKKYHYVEAAGRE